MLPSTPVVWSAQKELVKELVKGCPLDLFTQKVNNYIVLFNALPLVDRTT